MLAGLARSMVRRRSTTANRSAIVAPDVGGMERMNSVIAQRRLSEPWISSCSGIVLRPEQEPCISERPQRLGNGDPPGRPAANGQSGPSE